MNASSVSYAEENHEKLIQASVMANMPTAKPSSPSTTWSSASACANCEPARLNATTSVRS